MKDNFETTSCPACSSSSYDALLRVPDRFNIGTGDEYNLVRCQECSLTFLNPRPRPEAIAAYYESAEYQPFVSTQEGLSISQRAYVAIREFMLRKKRGLIEARKSAGRLLDIGCGTGEFLNEMQNNGWKVQGIEKDAAATRFAQERYKLHVTSDNLADCKFEADSFDVITMWHVLEHLYDPQATLLEIHRLLHQDGLLLIAVPNISSFDASRYRENWVALDAPRHLSHFTPATMEFICNKAALHLHGVKQMPFDVYFNVLMSEKLLMARYNPSPLQIPFYAGRSVCIAGISFFRGLISARSGSSLLYIVGKQNSIG